MNRVRSSVGVSGSPVDGRGVRIAVIDTGVDRHHPDLEGRILHESRGPDRHHRSITDEEGHGTHIAGIIAGTGAASNGDYRGIAPAAEILAIKVRHDAGEEWAGDVLSAVYYALDVGVDIINYSGGVVPKKVGKPWKWSNALTQSDKAFEDAAAAGVLVIASAGNEGPARGSVMRPCGLPNVLCVGAVDFEGNLVPSSSRGPVYLGSGLDPDVIQRARRGDKPADLLKPDVVAPGGFRPGGRFRPRRKGTNQRGVEAHLASEDGQEHQIVSARSRNCGLLRSEPTNPKCVYTRMAGTSQAAAAVTGLAALAIEYAARQGIILGKNGVPSLAEILRGAARRPRPGAASGYGHGILRWPEIAATLDTWKLPRPVNARAVAITNGVPSS